jgi:predicted dehydrogenase
MKKIGVGIIGCGNISGIYMKNLTEMYHNVELLAICDLDEAKTKAAAKQYGIQTVCTMEQMLQNRDIDIVINLTTPAGHFEICKKILLAGKNAYVEKPLSLSLEQGKELVALAEEKGLLLGGAPDTFMGAGIQTASRVINDGIIGKVIGATAFMMCHGHESWHPAPEFYYQKGGGPMFDMGPYYLTALVSMIGSVESVTGMTAKSFETRTITSQPQFGKVIEVEVPTYVSGTLRFQNGAIGNLITTFDVWGSTLPRIEVYGTRGSMIVPDPNTFGGEVMVKQHFASDFEKMPLLCGHSENSRGYGVSDMADCLQTGRKNLRASGRLALHVLEIMHAIHESSDTERFIHLTTSCDKPEPLPL